MTELTNIQRDILLHAIEHTEGRVVWFPPNLKGGARDKVLEALFVRGLITPVGDLWLVGQKARAALGIEQTQEPPAPAIEARQDAPAPERPKRQMGTTQRVLELLKQGATVQDLAAATGWQPHSLRSLLCHGLPRQGYRILAEKSPGSRQKRYRLAASDTEAINRKEPSHD